MARRSTSRLQFLRALPVLFVLLGLAVLGLVVFANQTKVLMSFNVLQYNIDLPVLGGSPLVATSEEQSLVAVSQEQSPPVVGYAISVTACQPNDERLDQAAILLYSIHLNSRRNPDSGSKYDYMAYAFVHPEAANCTDILTTIGYEVQVRESPVLKEHIQGRLKEFVHEASCCQEKEFLKLYSYTLVDHSVVVHLDLDCLVLQPLDDLFDSMMEGPNSVARQRLPLQWDKNNTNLPDEIEAFFTRDYNLVDPGRRQPHQIGIQGGFIVVKPDMDVFNQYRETIIDGNYTNDQGWGGDLEYGGYYGAAQIQGLCAYFFGAVRPRKTLELNRCYYNFMADAPRGQEGNKCRTLEEDCQDCRNVGFEEIKTIHFTLCRKPWWCQAHESNLVRKSDLGGEEGFELCLAAHKQWFRTRYLLEKEWSEKDAYYTMTPDVGELGQEATHGFCQRKHITEYVPMQFPKKRIEL